MGTAVDGDIVSLRFFARTSTYARYAGIHRHLVDNLGVWPASCHAAPVDPLVLLPSTMVVEPMWVVCVVVSILRTAWYSRKCGLQARRP